ncbi:MAG: immunoglobulin-like domain-containing protein [Bacteroidota bacterium]
MKKRILSLATVLFIGGSVVLTSCGGDEEAPIITLKGDAIEKIDLGSAYTDAGVTADDNEDGDVSANVTNDATTAVDNKKAGKYTVTYKVSDEKANEGTATREVWVVVSPKVLVGSYDVVDLVGSSSTPYTDNISTSSANDYSIVCTKFAFYSNAGVVMELSGDLGTDVKVAANQTYVSGSTPASRTFAGTGTVAEDGKSFVINYTETTNGSTVTGKGTYTKK